MTSSRKQNSEQLSLLTLLPEDHRASLRVLPGSDKARKMTAGSGLRLCGPWLPSGRLGACLKTLLGSEVWGSTVSFLTWRVWNTRHNRWIFRLQESEPTISDTACGFLPTMTQDAANGVRWKKFAQGGTPLNLVFNFYPTLTAHDIRHGANPERTSQMWKTSARGVDLPNLLRFSGLGDGGINPYWAEEFMGFPEGWIDLEPSETP